MKAKFRYHPDADTFGGLFGNWTVEIIDGGKTVGGYMAGYGQCCEYVKKRKVRKKDWEFDDASRKQAYREYFNQYRR